MMSGKLGAKAPDSKIAAEATELARRDCPPHLFNHCLRTFFFGDALAARGLRFDREVFYVAAVLHDLGLLESYDRGGRFEVDGADAARDFLMPGRGRSHPAPIDVARLSRLGGDR